ncbi:hypothetical protein EW145_g630 [Phellinidium pouzarii]|uniref:Inhibitor of growth protein N-terminal histone-binding domain-containing protein n=1 Tax=Phellinidium pouzarii TaxID=167371 RepID=A0A4S4LJH1_9AGAM|nr:hypothetical protein EW145_g630 [Phellinidium pouzarii]
MNTMAVANQEEAAAVTAEFLSEGAGPGRPGLGFARLVSAPPLFTHPLRPERYFGADAGDVGLDNLPNEVQHLLAEIRHKETRAQGEYSSFLYKSLSFSFQMKLHIGYESCILTVFFILFYLLLPTRRRSILSPSLPELQQEIQKDTTRYIRHSVRNSATREGKEIGKDKDSKDLLIPGRVTIAYAELDQIALEKINLAARLVETITRVNARLEHDLAKVVTLSGEPAQEQYEVRGGYVVGTLPGAAGAPSALSAIPQGVPTTASRAVREVQESLRASTANDVVVIPPVVSATQGTHKRRRLNTGVSVASVNATASRGHTPQARSRLALQVHPSPPATSRGRRLPSYVGDDDADVDNDADADGDIDDPEEAGDPEDKEIYCYCRKTSYGEVCFYFRASFNLLFSSVGLE